MAGPPTPDAEAQYPAYDRIAALWERRWGGIFARPALLDVYDRLLMRRVPAGARLLDLCCGSGQVASALRARGYRVTALDGACASVRLGKTRDPQVRFLVADARRFALSPVFDGALCVNSSINYILSAADRAALFRNVAASLRPGGWLAFDAHDETGYRTAMGHSRGEFHMDLVCVQSSLYRETERLGEETIVQVTPTDPARSVWRREDTRFLSRPCEPDEMRAAAQAAGFIDLETYDAARDLRIPASVLDPRGRRFYACRKPGGR